jgi:hypothetical protein
LVETKHLTEYLTERKKKNQTEQKAKYTTNAQYTYTPTVLNDTKKGGLQQAKGDCPDCVHADQMVVGTVKQEAPS